MAAELKISLNTPKTSADEPPMYFFLGFQGRDISQITTTKTPRARRYSIYPSATMVSAA